MATLRRVVVGGEQYLHTGDLVAMLREAPPAIDRNVTVAMQALANLLAERDTVTGGGIARAIPTSSGLLLPPR